MFDYTPTQAASLLGPAFWNARQYVDQYWWGLAERQQATGQESPFPQNWNYNIFHVDSIDDNGDGSYTIHDASQNWITAASHKRWIDAVPGEFGVPPWATTTGYHAVIDAERTGAGLSKPDPLQVIRGPIFDNALTSIRVTLPVAEWVRQRRISVLSDLVGRYGWIMRTNGYDWTRAFIDRPNGPMWSYGKIVASAAGTLTSDRAIQHSAVAVGKQILYFAGGVMQRGTISAVNAVTRTFTYTGTTAVAVVSVPPVPFFVVNAGDYFQWRDDPTPTGPGVQCAWAGLGTNYYAHATGKFDDNHTTVLVPKLRTPVSYAVTLDACPIDPEQWDVRASAKTLGRDPDTYIPQDNVCGPGDILVMQKFWRCWRAIWSGYLWVCEKFATRAIYDNDNPSYIAPFTIATALYDAAVNVHTGTTGATIGGAESSLINCAIAVPHTPINLWWTITDATGKPLRQGWTPNYNGTTLNASGDETFTTGVHNGKPVKASLGPRRLVEREFSRMLPATFFLAGIDGDPPAAQPVSELFPGTFYTDPASVSYLMSDLDGLVRPSALPRHQFADGHKARYVGHRTYDPGFPVMLAADVPDPLAEFYNNGSVGTRTKPINTRLIEARSGRATSGSNRRIVVKGRNFDALDFYSDTNGKTHAFTPATGGTTGATVPGAAGSTLWALARFPFFAGPMIGFTFEVIINGGDLSDPNDFGDPAAIIERRIIATGTTGGVATWSEPTSATVVGRACRIVEPLVLNPWKGLKVKLTKDTGATATVVIEGNRYDTLFIPDPGFAVGADTTFEIIVPRLGDVFMRVAGEWVTTSGAGVDARFGGSTYRAKAQNNQADVMTEYGLPLPMDRSTHSLAWHTELFNFVNVITDVIGAFPAFHGYASDDSPENNSRGSGNVEEINGGVRATWHTLYGHLETEQRDNSIAKWTSHPDYAPYPEPAANPYSAIHHMVDEEFGYLLAYGKAYAYLEVPAYALPSLFPIGYSSRLYVWATIGGDPGPDPGVVTASGIRTETFFDASAGLPFRQWQGVGGGAPGTRVKVGGDINTPPNWGTLLNESEIESIDHPDGTLSSWHVFGGYAIARRESVHRIAFKFGP